MFTRLELMLVAVALVLLAVVVTFSLRALTSDGAMARPVEPPVAAVTASQA